MSMSLLDEFAVVEMPKSASLTWPVLVRRMLAPLMSRWTTNCECK